MRFVVVCLVGVLWVGGGWGVLGWEGFGGEGALSWGWPPPRASLPLPWGGVVPGVWVWVCPRGWGGCGGCWVLLGWVRSFGW